MADYVIVGAGSADCVLAEALSARHSVVVLEAGSAKLPIEVSIPAAFSKLFKTSVDWDLTSEPEPGAARRSLYLPRGKMVGGSSSMNAMLYMRGRPSDYETWESQGATGWDWETVLEVFKAMESNSRGQNEFHGDRGPLRVDDLHHITPLSRRFVEAAMAAGIPANSDFNGSRQLGAGFFQVTQRNGRRWSAADAFLRPALRRPTLDLRTNALVTRLLLDRGRAAGVEYIQDGQVVTVEAEAGVILTAGAFGSPHILQLSGIGDPTHLSSIGIHPLVDSPEVGTNLHDHPTVAAIHESTQPDTLDNAENALELARWLLFRRGKLASPVAEACAFVKSDGSLPEPDLQFHFGPVNFDNHGLQPYEGYAFTFGPVLVNPRSRGSVRARSADPAATPEIRVNALTARADVDALVRGIGIARDIASRQPFDDYRGRELKPGREVRTLGEIETFLRENVELLYHPVGTCRMGSDDRAVVGPDLKVNGVDSLWVADASVMPTVTSGNTNAPTMMIASRAAGLIIAS
ncbi:MAG: GMC family oxidoreductase [Actinomycetota bacterium]